MMRKWLGAEVKRGGGGGGGALLPGPASGDIPSF